MCANTDKVNVIDLKIYVKAAVDNFIHIKSQKINKSFKMRC